MAGRTSPTSTRPRGSISTRSATSGPRTSRLGRAVVGYVRPSGGGPFHSYGVHLGAEGALPPTGAAGPARRTPFSADFQLRSFDSFGVNLNALGPRRRARAGAVGRGTARPLTPRAARPLDLLRPRPALLGRGLVGGGRTWAAGAAPRGGVVGHRLDASRSGRTRAWRPRLDAGYDHSRWPARWIDAVASADGRPADQLFAGSAPRRLGDAAPAGGADPAPDPAGLRPALLRPRELRPVLPRHRPPGQVHRLVRPATRRPARRVGSRLPRRRRST